MLPINEVEKSKLLPIKSPRLRLRLVVYWIEQLKSNWCAAALVLPLFTRWLTACFAALRCVWAS